MKKKKEGEKEREHTNKRERHTQRRKREKKRKIESPSSKTHPVAFQSLRTVLLLLLEAAAALALVEYVRRELPALGAGATDARRAARHRDTCELTATTGQQHRSSLTPFFICHCRTPLFEKRERIDSSRSINISHKL